jgi:hypothetical protein
MRPVCGRRNACGLGRLASGRLSTFPQPRSSTAARWLTCTFTQIIHRLMHRTLTLHPRGRRDRSMLSCWSRSFTSVVAGGPLNSSKITGLVKLRVASG